MADAQRRGAANPLIVGVVALLLALGIVYVGKDVRKWTWQETSAIRYRPDIENAFLWGQFSNIVGVRYTYDELLRRHGGDYSHQFKLDYPPLRLLVAAAWTELLQKIDPGIRKWRNEYVLTFPLLYLNYLTQIVTAVVLFVLVRLWYLRHHGAAAAGQVARSRAALLAGLAVGLLLLFNPALILNSHGWPQWDSWLLVFFAGAVLAASVDRWALAGACIGAGCLLKGQILVAAPVIPLVAAFQGQWRGVLAFLLAGLAAALLLVLPWWLRDPLAVPYIVVVTAAGGLAAFFWSRSPGRRSMDAGLAAMAAFCLAAASTYFLFETSTAWFHIGYGYGVRRNTASLAIGTSPNLPQALQHYFDVRVHSGLNLPGGGYLPVTTMLIAGYLCCLVYSAWRAARFKQSGDGAFLVAVFAPWLFMYAFMPYMHERYLVYIAALSATWVFLGMASIVVHGLLVALAFGAMFHMMLLTSPGAAPDVLEWFELVYPADSWLVVALALAVLAALSRKPASSRASEHRGLMVGMRVGQGRL